MLIGVCGKTNVGKTSFFSAATLVDAEISNRIFTTIEPNKGVAYVRAKCPCSELKTKCSPRSSKCVEGTRLIPVKLVDVAGLVPDAHKGKGLGNKFLSDIMEASAIIHVLDISGSTDSNGNPVPAGTHNPEEDIDFFVREIDYWIAGILSKIMKQGRMLVKREELISLLHKQLSGLGISFEDVEFVVNTAGITSNSSEQEIMKFIEILRNKSKPIIIAANKIDVQGAGEIYEKLKSKYNMTACSAVSELALRKATEKGIIDYIPGSSAFSIKKDLDEKQKKALDFIQSVLSRHGTTGVQSVIDKAVFSLLDMIVVYPVENEHKFSDKQGNILPDAFLMKRGSTALNLAYKVHEDIGKKFISAIDCKTHKSVSSSYMLKDGDIISIKAGK